VNTTVFAGGIFFSQVHFRGRILPEIRPGDTVSRKTGLSGTGFDPCNREA
jgi:hypothetical protein